MSQPHTQPLQPSPPPQKSGEVNLIPYDPSDDIVYKRRFQIIKSLVHALEDENNLIALKIAQMQARLESAKVEIPPQVSKFGLPLSASPGPPPAQPPAVSGSIAETAVLGSNGAGSFTPGDLDGVVSYPPGGQGVETNIPLSSQEGRGNGRAKNVKGEGAAHEGKSKPKSKPRAKKVKEEPQLPSSPIPVDDDYDMDSPPPRIHRPAPMDDEDDMMDDY